MEKKGKKGSKSFGFLQSLSQSFMTPVAILPLAGLLLGVGAALQTGLLIEQLPWLDSGIWPMVSSVLRESGNIVFSNLGLIFAIGVAMGMSENDGVAGMAAAIGYLIMNKMISVVGNITPEMIMLEENRGKYTTVLGIPTLQMGVFAGILVGLMTAYLFKKFHQQKLPSVLEFFQGKRLVIIVTAVSSIGLGIASLFIWPYIQNGINWVSSNAIESNKFLSMYVYGFANKALIPVGLHHVENVPFWYMFGEYVNKAGEVINGDYNIYFAQLTDGVPITAGLFMSGSYLLKMFALPGAAFAMYRCAKPENRKKAGGLLLSVAFTAFATGITEPIEFMILFAGLPLYGFYVVTAGLAYIVCYIFNIHIALTFAGGLIDFSLLGILQNANNWYLMIPLGMCFFALYYFSFKWMILKFNFKTPGRENTEEIEKYEGFSSFSAEDSLEKK